MPRGLIAALLSLASLPALACDYPSPTPEIPDGKTATKEVMMTAQQGVKEFVAKMDTYLTCLDQEAAALGEAVTEAEQHVHAEKHNAAVTAMEGVADKFNNEVRLYKEAQQGHP